MRPSPFATYRGWRTPGGLSVDARITAMRGDGLDPQHGPDHSAAPGALNTPASRGQLLQEATAGLEDGAASRALSLEAFTRRHRGQQDP